MKELVKKIWLYNDGTYEEENIINRVTTYDVPKKAIEILSNNLISKRVAYNLSTYLIAKELYLKCPTNDYICESFSIVSKTAGVTYATVADNSHRRLDLNSNEYRKVLTKALKGDRLDLKKKLISNIGEFTQDADRALIEEILN